MASVNWKWLLEARYSIHWLSTVCTFLPHAAAKARAGNVSVRYLKEVGKSSPLRYPTSAVSSKRIIGAWDAAVAGVMYCSFSTSLMPTTGSMPGIKAFTAAVFGGIGSIPGAFLGGILLGIIESLAKAYISTQLANSIVFAVLIVTLLVRPAGLLGKYVPEKV